MLTADSSLGRFVLAVRGADLSGRPVTVPPVAAGGLERLGRALALQSLPERRPPGAHRLEPSPERRRQERRVQGGLGLLAVAGALCALLPLSQRAIGIGRPEIAGLHVEVAALSLPAAAPGSRQREWKVVAKGRTRNSQGLYCWLVGLDRRTGKHRYLSAPTPCTPDLEIVLTVIASDLEWVGWDVIAGRLKVPCTGPGCQDLRNIDVVTATGDTMAAKEVPSSSLTAFPVPASPSATLPAGGPSTTTTGPSASGPELSPVRSGDGRAEYPTYVLNPTSTSQSVVPTGPSPSVTRGPTSSTEPVGTERPPDDGQATDTTSEQVGDTTTATTSDPGTTSGTTGETTSATPDPTGDPSPGATTEPTGGPGEGPSATVPGPSATP